MIRASDAWSKCLCCIHRYRQTFLFRSSVQWLKVSLHETDTDDPSLFTNFATLSILTHRQVLGAGEIWKYKSNFFRRTQSETPAWNQNFAVKIACWESLFAAWEVNAKNRVIYIWKIYEPFLEFSASSKRLAVMLRGVKLYLHTLHNNGQSLHKKHGKSLDGFTWSGRHGVERNASDIEQPFDDFNSHYIRVNLEFGHAATFYIVRLSP